MTTPVRSIDERLLELASGHFDADVRIPPILDVTGASSDAVAAVRALPLTGRVFDADAALRWELVDELVT